MNTILVTNDDGIQSEALNALAYALSDIANVVIVAPEINQSACSRKITMDKPLRITNIDDLQGQHAPIKRFVVNGTPVDCVHLGVHHILDAKPNLIASGINKGLNIGSDIPYSGTVGAAIAGCSYGIPSFAISQDVGHNLQAVSNQFANAAYFGMLTAQLIQRQPDWNTDICINVNCPQNVSSKTPYVWVETGKRLYDNRVRVCIDPRGEAYYWIGDGAETQSILKEGTDCAAIANNYVSLSPLKFNTTCVETLAMNWDRTFVLPTVLH